MRAMSGAELAESARSSLSHKCNCTVSVVEYREYDGDDSDFLTGYLAAERVADLANIGSVVLVVLQMEGMAGYPYQGLLIHRDSGGLFTISADAAGKILDRFPTPNP